jgi:ankyrin repeat protein
LNLLQTDANSFNAFLVAAYNNRVEVMRVLTKLGCNIYSTAKNGSTALHLAVKQGHIGVVRELLKIKKFPIDAKKRNGLTAAALAVLKGDIVMLELLVSAGCDINSVSS